MAFEDIFTVLTFLTGAVIAGEGAALYLGMNVFRKGSKWVTAIKNRIISLDILVGGGLMIFAIANDSNLFPHIITVFSLVGIFTHGLLELEHFYNLENKFLSNVPLRILNILTLICIIAVFVMVVILYYL